MKLDTQTLRKIIKETLNESAGLDPTKKAALQKQTRDDSISKQTAGVGKLTQVEVDVVTVLRQVIKTLESPGTQVSGTAKNLVIRLRDEIGKTTKK